MDNNGLWTWVITEKIPKSLFPKGMKSRYSKHPRFSTFDLERVEVKKDKSGEFYQIDYYYNGFFKVEGFSGEGKPEPTYTLSISTSEEPIQLHPDFEEIAGTPSKPKNGAVFIDPETGKPTKNDAKGVFREFSISGKEFAGIESFLSPGATWTEVSFETSRPRDLGQLGTIDTPSGPVPQFGGSRNWLYYSVEYIRRGHLYEVRKTWLLSKKGGWNKTIYGNGK